MRSFDYNFEWLTKLEFFLFFTLFIFTQSNFPTQPLTHSFTISLVASLTLILLTLNLLNQIESLPLPKKSTDNKICHRSLHKKKIVKNFHTIAKKATNKHANLWIWDLFKVRFVKIREKKFDSRLCMISMYLLCSYINKISLSFSVVLPCEYVYVTNRKISTLILIILII